MSNLSKITVFDSLKLFCYSLQWTNWCFKICLSFLTEMQSQAFQDWILQFLGNMHHVLISRFSQLRGLMVCIKTSCIREMPDFSPTNLSILKVPLLTNLLTSWVGFVLGQGAFVKARIREWKFMHSVNIYWESMLCVRLYWLLVVQARIKPPHLMHIF